MRPIADVIRDLRATDKLPFHKRKMAMLLDNNLGGDMGNLNSFPYMTLSEDSGVDAAGGDNIETIKMSKIDDEIAKIYLVALNFTDAKENNTESSFADYDGKITFMNETGESFEVVLNSKDKGTAALIAILDNTSPIGTTIQNTSEVMDLQTLIEKVPGSRAILK